MKYVVDEGKNLHEGYDTNEADNEIVEALTTTQYNTLQTDAKTIIGAINEIAAGGGSTAWQPLKNGKTNLWLKIPKEDKNIQIICRQSSLANILIDWGDGNNERVTGAGASTNKTIAHTYADAGDYILSIWPQSGTFNNFSLGGGTSSAPFLVRNTYYDFNKIRNIELCANTNAYAFQRNYSAENVYIDKEVNTIGDETFEYLYTLRKIQFEERTNDLTFGGNYNFAYAYGLREIVFSSHIPSIVNGFFISCYALENLELPEGVTTIESGFVGNCKALNRIIIPSTVTAINGSSQFNGCENLAEIHVKPTTPPTIGTFSLQTNTKIYVPTGKLTDYQTAWPNYSSYMVEE